jgi:hypothetical protein
MGALRRTAAQKAMAHDLFPDAKQGADHKSKSSLAAKLDPPNGFSAARLFQAQAVLAYSPGRERPHPSRTVCHVGRAY